MRVVVQRISKASVEINGIVKASVNNGLLIFLGIEINDDSSDAEWLVQKISQLRIFNDSNNLMNLNISEINGEILVVSQFTLHAKTKKGNRPSFIHAAKPDHAIPLYNLFVEKLAFTGIIVKTGEFGAMMSISLINDGPVTIIIDSKNRE
jgi:D-tyrosyl-tRNA(Tyr) deacylase